MTKKQGITWEVWLEELKRVGKCAGFIDVNADEHNTYWEEFRMSYDADMTPAEAMLEDMSYA